MRNYFYLHSQSTKNEDFVIARRCLGLVHTYLVNPAYESVFFLIRFPEWKFLNTLWIRNRLDAKSPLYREYCIHDGNLDAWSFCHYSQRSPGYYKGECGYLSDDHVGYHCGQTSKSLSTIKICGVAPYYIERSRNDLRENKNYFELAGVIEGTSYRG